MDNEIKFQLKLLKEIDYDKNSKEVIKESINLITNRIERYFEDYCLKNEGLKQYNNDLQNETIKLYKENKQLNKRLEMLLKKEYPFIVENGIICEKNKEIENLQKENNKLNNIIIKTIDYLEDAQKSLEEWHFDSYDPRLDIIINELKVNKQ